MLDDTIPIHVFIALAMLLVIYLTCRRADPSHHTADRLPNGDGDTAAGSKSFHANPNTQEAR